MSLITPDLSGIVDGQTADASDVTNPLNTIIDDYNGNITNDNIAATAAIALTKLASTGWTTHTPTIAQGASSDITKTTTYSKYQQIGKTVFWNFRLAITGAGSAGSAVTVTLPVTAAQTSQPIGIGDFYDASGPNSYVCRLVVNLSTNMVFSPADTAVANRNVGTDPNVAMANGDYLQGSVVYEAA